MAKRTDPTDKRLALKWLKEAAFKAATKRQDGFDSDEALVARVQELGLSTLKSPNVMKSLRHKAGILWKRSPEKPMTAQPAPEVEANPYPAINEPLRQQTLEEASSDLERLRVEMGDLAYEVGTLEPPAPVSTGRYTMRIGDQHYRLADGHWKPYTPTPEIADADLQRAILSELRQIKGILGAMKKAQA